MAISQIRSCILYIVNGHVLDFVGYIRSYLHCTIVYWWHDKCYAVTLELEMSMFRMFSWSAKFCIEDVWRKIDCIA